MERRIEVREVGPRDGLQNEEHILKTSDKIHLIEALVSAGLKNIEITSFVNPKWVPQFYDAGEVLQHFLGRQKYEKVTFIVLVPNLKGAVDAIENGASSIALFMSASEAHNLANVNMTIEDSLAQLKEVAALATQRGVSMRGYIVTAFGCPYQGDVPIEDVKRICKAYLEMGVEEISLGDTTGMAQPEQVQNVLNEIMPLIKEGHRIAVHFHNTRGLGLVNAYAAYQCGITIFDAAIGGLGGCPFAPGATGNIATEDIVHMFTAMGVETGIDLKALKNVNRILSQAINKELPAYLGKVDPIWEIKSNDIEEV